MRCWQLLAGCMVGLCLGGAGHAAEPASEAGTNKVFIVPVRDVIASPMVYLVRRGVKEAMEAEADLLVIDMNTDGGRVDATEEIMQIIARFPGETATYVNQRAFSAGAFIAVATGHIFMAPQSVIGAAAPIMVSPGGGSAQEMPNTMEVKLTSALSALVRTAAEKNGHDPDVVMAMIDKSRTLRKVSWSTNDQGEVLTRTNLLSDKGQILTLTETEAVREYGQPPEPLLSAGIKESMEEVLAALGYAGVEPTRVAPTRMEQLGTWLNAISPILLLVGIIGLYIEFKTPGFGFPGIVGLLAIGLYFLSGYVAGLSGAEWVLVFIVGLALVVVEMFVLPGTLFIGLTGAALMLVAIVMALLDVYPNPGPGLPTLPNPAYQLKMRALDLLIVIVGAGVGIWILSRLLPKTSMYRILVSDSAVGMGTEERLAQQGTLRQGREGEALSTLRPGGKARFGDEILDVVTEGEMVEAGTRVRIIGTRGSDALVEPVG